MSERTQERLIVTVAITLIALAAILAWAWVSGKTVDGESDARSGCIIIWGTWVDGSCVPSQLAIGARGPGFVQ